MSGAFLIFKNFLKIIFLNFFARFLRFFLKQKFKSQNPKLVSEKSMQKNMIKAKQDSISRLALLFAYFLYICLKINC